MSVSSVNSSVNNLLTRLFLSVVIARVNSLPITCEQFIMNSLISSILWFNSYDSMAFTWARSTLNGGLNSCVTGLNFHCFGLLFACEQISSISYYLPVLGTPNILGWLEIANLKAIILNLGCQIFSEQIDNI